MSPDNEDAVIYADRHYKQKTLFIRVGKIIRASQEEARVKIAVGVAANTFFVGKVKKLMDELGLWTDIRHMYLAYALALDKTQGEFGWMVDLVRAHQILRNRFELRGLDAATLDRLDQLVIYRTADSM
jgi:hypothetical protein